MFREVFETVYHNKNILMFCSVCIYILALFSVFSASVAACAILFTLFLIFLLCKDFLPIKVVIIWALIFYIGIINTSVHIKKTDELLNIAPINATVYGKILTIPQIKGDKQRFFFKVNKIEYDNIARTFDKEKILVSLNKDEGKFDIYDSLKIRGRLSPPFKAGNPSQFDYGNYLRNHDAYAVLYGKNPYDMRNANIPCFEKITPNYTPKETLLRKINNARTEVLQVHSKYLPSPNLEILGGIVFGDDAVSPPENIKESFVNSGLLHILAASGMNVAFIYSFFFFFLNLFRINYRVNISICILMVITYVFMTGLGASVLRAALMLLFVLVGKLIDRDANSISLLSFVAFLMLLYNPMYLNDVGFQLSFIVTFGLLMMMPYIIKTKYRIVNWIVGSLVVPIIAQLWVIPVQIFYFNNISIYSVFANIMSVPILSVISFGGFVSSLISVLTPFADIVCKVFDFILDPLICILVNISDFWGNLPNANIQTTHPNPLQIIIYYLILINLTLFFNKDVHEKWDKWGKYIKLIFSSLIFILFLSTIPIKNHNLEITAFDVGNADSFMIKTPENKYIMIDTGKGSYNGGKSQAEIILLKYMKDVGIKSLDTIIVTHFDNDHCGGTVDLIKNLNVKTLYVNSLKHNSNDAISIYKTAKTNGVNIIKAENLQTVIEEKGFTITNFLANQKDDYGDNENSIITLLKYNDFTMLFMGDAGIAAFNDLKQNLPKNITVLKVGHHGASGVVNREMLNYLNPKISIISTGENKFGHPSSYTTELLKNTNILRTDINNAIRVVVNQKGYGIHTYDDKLKTFNNKFYQYAEEN